MQEHNRSSPPQRPCWEERVRTYPLVRRGWIDAFVYPVDDPLDGTRRYAPRLDAPYGFSWAGRAWPTQEEAWRELYRELLARFGVVAQQLTDLARSATEPAAAGQRRQEEE